MGDSRIDVGHYQTRRSEKNPPRPEFGIAVAWVRAVPISSLGSIAVQPGAGTARVPRFPLRLVEGPGPAQQPQAQILGFLLQARGPDEVLPPGHRRPDEALYAAKANGRDRAGVYRDVRPCLPMALAVDKAPTRPTDVEVNVSPKDSDSNRRGR